MLTLTSEASNGLNGLAHLAWKCRGVRKSDDGVVCVRERLSIASTISLSRPLFLGTIEIPPSISLSQPYDPFRGESKD